MALKSTNADTHRQKLELHALMLKRQDFDPAKMDVKKFANVLLSAATFIMVLSKHLDELKRELERLRSSS